MIPFPILNKTHVNPPADPLDIVDIQTNYATTYLLYNNGYLYGVGNNGYNTLGVVGTQNTWVLLNTSIRRIVSTGIWSACFESTSGEFLMTGRTYGLGVANGQSAENIIKFEPLSKFLPPNISINDIKDVKCSTACIILTRSGEVWGVGSNSNYTLGYSVRPAYVTQFTKISNAGMVAEEIGLSYTNSYIKIGNLLYGMGTNQNRGLGSPSGDPSSTFVQIASGVVAFGYNRDITTVLITDGRTLSTGENFNGQTGTNSLGTSTVTKFTYQTPITAGAKVILQQCSGNSNGVYPAIQNGIYIKSAGSAVTDGLGNNYSGKQFSMVNARTPFITKESDVKLLAAESGSTYCITDKNELWGWGNSVVGYTTPQVYPVKLQLPLAL